MSTTLTMDAMLLLLGGVVQLPRDRLLRAARATAARRLLVGCFAAAAIYIPDAGSTVQCALSREDLNPHAIDAPPSLRHLKTHNLTPDT